MAGRSFLLFCFVFFVLFFSVRVSFDSFSVFFYFFVSDFRYIFQLFLIVLLVYVFVVSFSFGQFAFS